jgi:hypothetical protein
VLLADGVHSKPIRKILLLDVESRNLSEWLIHLCDSIIASIMLNKGRIHLGRLSLAQAFLLQSFGGIIPANFLFGDNSAKQARQSTQCPQSSIELWPLRVILT